MSEWRPIASAPSIGSAVVVGIGIGLMLAGMALGFQALARRS